MKRTLQKGSSFEFFGAVPHSVEVALVAAVSPPPLVNDGQTVTIIFKGEAVISAIFVL